MMLTIDAVEAVYEPLRDEINREQMERYMKHQFSFLGIKKTQTAPLIKALLNTYELPVDHELKQLVQQCFLKNEREYHYFGMALLKRQKKTLSMDDFPFIEALMLQHSWWDSIDDLSPNIVGPLVLSERAAGEIHMKRWLQCDNFWIQRAALLHQLKYKEQMNEELLIEMIEHLKDNREFFIRKAIGWVLREYSKINRDFVINYVEQASLSPLSSREALKWLNSKSTPETE